MAIASLNFTRPPDGYDQNGQPLFGFQQEKGLFESADRRLTARAKLEGYTDIVAKILVSAVCAEVRRTARGRPLDIIELGGGAGHIFDLLPDTVNTYINVDPGERLFTPADIARLQHPKYQLLRCSADDLPLPDASADLVLSVASFDHIPDARRALLEVRRVLRRGGTFVLVLNNRRSWWKRILAKSEYLKRREAWIATQHYIQWSCADCADAVGEFMIVRRLDTLTYVPFISRLWRVLLPIADSIGPHLMPHGGANVIAVSTNDKALEKADRDPSRPRVLRIITRLNIGGPAIQALTLSTGLDAAGFDTRLVHGRLGPGEGDMRTLLSTPPPNAAYMPSLRRPIDPLNDSLTFWRLLALMRRMRPDIVHTHTAKAGAIGRLAAIAYNMGPGRRSPARLVHTYHGHVLEGYFSPRTTSVFLRLERALARRTDALVAVSPAIRRELLEDFGIGRADRFHVVPLGFNLDALAAIDDRARSQARVELGLPADVPVVTWVGRLTAIKQPRLFLETARLVANTWPQTQFLLVGDGELRGEVDRSLGTLGLADRVHLLGWRGDLVRIYGATDVFALTSRNEGTPVALIEAMAAALPSVSPDVGGIRDVVLDSRLGIVVPDASAQRLAAAVCSLLDAPVNRREMGERARQSVLPRFGFERLVTDITALYRNLTGCPTCPTPGRVV